MIKSIFNWLDKKATQLIDLCTTLVDWLLDEPKAVYLNERRLSTKGDKREAQKTRFLSSRENYKKLSPPISPSINCNIVPKKILKVTQSNLLKRIHSVENTQILTEKKCMKVSEEVIPSKKNNSVCNPESSWRASIEKCKEELTEEIAYEMGKYQERLGNEMKKHQEKKHHLSQESLREFKEDCAFLSQKQTVLKGNVIVLKQEQAALKAERASINQKIETTRATLLVEKKRHDVLKKECRALREENEVLKEIINNALAKSGKQTQPTFFQPLPQPAMPAAPKSGDRETPQNNR